MRAKETELEPLQVDEDTASEITGVHKKTLYNERRRGKLGFVRVGSRILYEPSELRRWVAANRVQATK